MCLSAIAIPLSLSLISPFAVPSAFVDPESDHAKEEDLVRKHKASAPFASAVAVPGARPRLAAKGVGAAESAEFGKMSAAEQERYSADTGAWEKHCDAARTARKASPALAEAAAFFAGLSPSASRLGRRSGMPYLTRLPAWLFLHLSMQGAFRGCVLGTVEAHPIYPHMCEYGIAQLGAVAV